MVTRLLLGAAAVLALSSGLAAAPATVEPSAKVRAGPGTAYRVVATLRRGAVIDVGGCSGGWCEVAWRGRPGYVARTFLAFNSGSAPADVPPESASYEDDYPGFDYPGYAYAPAGGVPAAPRWQRYRGRSIGWHHRPGRFAVPDLTAGGTKGTRSTPGGAVVGASPGSAKEPVRSVAPPLPPAVVGGPPVSTSAVSTPALSAPIVTVPALAGPAAAAPAFR